MKAILYLSDFLVPAVLFYIIGFGVLSRRPVFDDFIRGAQEGMKTVAGILPTLIGLMTAVGVLRASGFLEFLSEILKAHARISPHSGELIPLILVRLVSSSAAHRASSRYFQDSWAGFPAGDDGVYYGELYRDGVLYHERVFYDGKGDEDALDSGRSRHFHSGRHRSQHSDCRFSDIKAYDGAVKILLALTVAARSVYCII